ncbi:tetratricopeptide repeat protein [Myxococcus landrumensis]|uniref:Tetratricopeptide repeat protein n=2 Tax=Myxococcus landrumensis TaxID=2813577 RepID=A0ABX7NH14_9BACT|nr:tetratricopeptide repeat protein [Myxococcus landrumus]
MPVDSFRLEARRHLLGVSSGRAALATLDPQVAYRIAETGTLASPDRGKPMPTIFFLLAGQKVAADAAVGIVTRKEESFRGATAVSFFTVGAPTPQDDLPERIVSVTNTRTGEERRHTIHLEWMTTDLKKSLFLDGLDPAETYTLSLSSVEGGAFTRGREQGPVVTVACVQQVSLERDGPGVPPARAQRFLVSQGMDSKVTGVHGLNCGFVDEDPTDNQGAVEIRIRSAAQVAAERAAAEREAEAANAVTALAAPAPEPAPVVISRPGGGKTPPPSRQAQPQVVEVEVPQETTRGGRALAQARELYKAKRFDAARTRARECVAMEPDNFECHLLLGSVAAQLNRLEEGAKHYRRFLDLAPSDHPQASKVLRVLQEYESVHAAPADP